MNEKDKYMTSLSGDRKISKAHGRIVFRGLIDSLEAELIEAQVLAFERDEKEICEKLGEVLDYLRNIMAAEVKETELKPPFLFGLDAKEIHWRSHHTGGFVLPSYTHGPVAARINTLRAKVREVELLAVRVFGEDPKPRDDIILALNRLSSALWWLFCSYINGSGEKPYNDKADYDFNN